MTDRTPEEIAAERLETLVEAAEHVLLHEAYMDLGRWNATWAELEAALIPLRSDCKRCGMANASPMHIRSEPYFCGQGAPERGEE